MEVKGIYRTRFAELMNRFGGLIERHWHWLRVVLLVCYVLFSTIYVFYFLFINQDPFNGVSDQ